MDDWSDYDDPDLWADPVRKWMMDWHTPVKRIFKKPRRWGGGGLMAMPGGASGQIQFNNNGVFAGFGLWNGSAITSLANGLIPQTLRIYNTVDNLAAPVNFERANIDWLSTPNMLTIGTEAGGSGVTRPMKLTANGASMVFGDLRDAVYPSSVLVGGGVMLTTDLNGFAVGSIQLNDYLINSQGTFGFGSGVDLFTSAADCFFARNSPGLINLVSAPGSPSGLRVYNISDVVIGPPGNSEFGMLDWTGGGNLLVIGTQISGTGTLRDWSLQKGSAVYLTSKIYTVATLPAAGHKNARLFVTDATQTLTAGIGTIVAGGGTNNVPVIDDGTNWRIG